MSLHMSNCLIDYTMDKYKSIPEDHPQFSLQRLSERELAIKLGKIRLAKKQAGEQGKRRKTVRELKTFREYDQLAAEYNKELTSFFQFSLQAKVSDLDRSQKEEERRQLLCELMEKKAILQSYIHKVDVLQALLEGYGQVILRNNINVCTPETFTTLLIEGHVRGMHSAFVKDSIESLFDWEIEISEQLRARMTRILCELMSTVNQIAS